MRRKVAYIPPWIDPKERKDGTITYWIRYRVENQERTVFAGTIRDQAEQKLVDYEIKWHRLMKGRVSDGVA